MKIRFESSLLIRWKRDRVAGTGVETNKVRVDRMYMISKDELFVVFFDAEHIEVTKSARF